jgi:glycosyltransferase involved in cell wall biosynthesis
MAKKKIFILGDGAGWIVDRIIDEMVRQLSNQFDFVKRSYTHISTEELVSIANGVDLTHYGNWDFVRHLGSEKKITKPVLMSVRSFRYQSYVKELGKVFNIHIINPALLADFPYATYIPDAIFSQFKPDHNFVVGMAYHLGEDKYKGFFLVKEACDSLGVELRVANDLDPDKMVEFYKSVDLVVVASEAEGFGSIAMECLAMNKPVITVPSGAARFLNCHKSNRNVPELKEAIGKFYTSPQVKDYNWENICNQFADLYERMICQNT